MLEIQDFNYHLPEELIATRPEAQRDQSKLLCVTSNEFVHSSFQQLPIVLQKFMGKNPLLIVNDTRVIHARLYGHKIPSGGRVELLVYEFVSAEATVSTGFIEQWRCLYRSNKSLKPGIQVVFDGDRPLRGVVIKNEGEGHVVIEFSGQGAFLETLEHVGTLPLPPYMHRPPEKADEESYQTFFAQNPGAVAAPTAGLHFTPALISQLVSAGVSIAPITLHVGPGTFMPVKTESIADHVMHTERYHIPQDTADLISQAKREGRPIVAVGTTVVRTLESAATEQGVLAGWGETKIFIYPPYRFKVVDALITNFHLPKSTLLMLVSAFAGRKRILAAYQEAITNAYRFYSYGDAMLIPLIMEDYVDF